ncbi:hypothetical protein V7111_20205 [Neobacillus niacini]|uniref:hypothetical protein n=1 Tax=Neobacillus niacini TaxID=86668 RepID=UPI0030029FE5
MRLLVALGVEMGCIPDQKGTSHYYMLNGYERVELTRPQYDLWILAQQCRFTIEKAAEFLQKSRSEIQILCDQLLQKQAIILWGEEPTEAFLNRFTILPRGAAGKRTEEDKQMLLSHPLAKPIEVSTAGHLIWMNAHRLVTLNGIVYAIQQKTGLSEDDIRSTFIYWVPYLIRHGLASLQISLVENGR